MKNHEDGNKLFIQVPELLAEMTRMDRIETWEWRFFYQTYKPVLHDMAGCSPSFLMQELYEINTAKDTPVTTGNT